ncbi:hypothetical protein [Pseudovibrio sp. Alg231-02]|uniref:hypothetical protein n=1 Tax=Pseudovibrio sp. Alg231-02 TaxID=1922223 RepID=UPI00131EF5A0|nr:hypothetical protein [Pseudovibrio sp. Alg231-02]
MNSATRTVEDWATSPYLVFLTIIATLGSSGWLVYDVLSEKPGAIPAISTSLSVIVFLAISIYSLTIRSENKNLRKIAEIFGYINSIYREKLKKAFGGDTRMSDEELMQLESDCLFSICQRIALIYSKVISKDCVVTIKLLVENDGVKLAKTYVRSVTDCERDQGKSIDYVIQTGANTAFDQACMPKPDGSSPYFCSGNLTKIKKSEYANQRQNYTTYYRSAIVVPIYEISVEKADTHEYMDLVGFLCIDTKSTNRLKEGFHVHMLTSLAGQIYNFMSLMRGKYSIRQEVSG